MADSHFLSEYVDGKPGFVPEPWYNQHGDCIVYHSVDEPFYGDRIDAVLTLYRAVSDDRVIGFQLKDISVIAGGMEQLGLFVETEEQEEISITGIVLLAFKKLVKEDSLRRTRGYTTLIDEIPPKLTIPRKELLSAN